MSDERARLSARVEAAQRRLMELAMPERSHELLSLDLTIQQLKVVMLLRARGELSAHDLAGALRVGLTTAAGIVDRLEDRGLARRRLDPADRRVRLIGLTDRGRTLATEFGEAGMAHHRRLLARLEPRVLANLAEAVEALADAAAAEAATADGEAGPGGGCPAGS